MVVEQKFLRIFHFSLSPPLYSGRLQLRRSGTVCCRDASSATRSHQATHADSTLSYKTTYETTFDLSNLFIIADLIVFTEYEVCLICAKIFIT